MAVTTEGSRRLVDCALPGVSKDRSAFSLVGDAVREFGMVVGGCLLARLRIAGHPSTSVSVGSLPACVSSLILYTAELLTRRKL